MTKLQRALRIRELAQMVSMDVDGIFDRPVVVGPLDRGADITPTEYCRTRTRLYRETWLLPLIDEIVAEERAKKEKRR
jgi:hypothetical protein